MPRKNGKLTISDDVTRAGDGDLSALYDDPESVDEAIENAVPGLKRRQAGQNGTPQAPPKPASAIRELNERNAVFYIHGTSSYMQHRFSEKALKKIQETQQAGSQARSKRVREARDFEADYRAAMYLMANDSGTDEYGIPASSFRNGMISACRTVGFHMTKAKLAVFIEEDGSDRLQDIPLVKLYGEPVMNLMPVRLETGVIDIRSRPLWRRWDALVRVRYDADMFSAADIFNLLYRMGRQVGIGEGRPDGKSGNGIGYGMFTIRPKNEWPYGEWPYPELVDEPVFMRK
jgi:hypothetical protein